MAQKPVANALTLELEPVVADNLARYLETANEWYAHDFVPFDQGENFAFLGGKDWDASQVTLPSDVVDALEVLLVTKDNLAGYHRELVEHSSWRTSGVAGWAGGPPRRTCTPSPSASTWW